MRLSKMFPIKKVSPVSLHSFYSPVAIYRRCRSHMTNPVLRKLSSRKLLPRDMADLMQKHVGDGENEGYCREACDALGRIRNDGLRGQVQLVLRFSRATNPDFTWCEVAREIIKVLRDTDLHYQANSFNDEFASRMP